MTTPKAPPFFERLVIVDALRGYALMGLFLVHCVEYFELYWLNPYPSVVNSLVFGLFGGKAFAIFALCFGLSFHIIMDRAARRGTDFSGRFVWRLTLLMVIGVLHGLIYRGDILTVLAPLGLLLIFIHRIRNNWILLALAGFLFLQPELIIRTISALNGADWALQPPYFLLDQSLNTFANSSFGDILAVNLWDGVHQRMSFYWTSGRMMQIVGLFILGLVLGRIGFFAQLDRHVTSRRILLGLFLLLGFGLEALTGSVTQMVPAGPDGFARQWFGQIWGSYHKLAFTGAQVILFVEVWRLVPRVMQTLAPVGRMTLTLYVGQSLLFVPVFYGYGLGLWDDWNQGQALTFGVITFGMQMIAASLWYRHYRYGPLEWLWRAATFGTVDIPFRRTSAA
ncbi:DUF418 domain-containing protein [Parvularcula sp. LCG005]|uniref:DUF418 domain-containing protein n=1 Tax=Parvularcula sp. LCG005 TaxID=3078805 RepID=UPI002943113B|nr:DUF418 domain-containing protein [Parvularcula sp. LCG005]WOI54768.1 DUF418 domain-containing protein [Parvularcula sp. LCG005]